MGLCLNLLGEDSTDELSGEVMGVDLFEGDLSDSSPD